MQGNEQQNRAIVWNTGPALVLAGPGSGKTFTIVERVRHLIEVCQVDPANILVVTFTRAAARQMRDRFLQRMQGVCHPVSFGTFHAVFFHILKTSYGYSSGCIATQRQKKEYLRTVLQGVAADLPAQADWEEGLLSEFGRLKNFGGSPEAFQSAYLETEAFREVFFRFNRMLREMGKLDLDEFAAGVTGLFQTRPETLAAWRRQFPYLLIDEFQDINPVQYEAVRLLAGEKKNLFVVGDDDQAIYGFRGSDPALMRQFLRDYPEAENITLALNYRSRPGIVETAGRLIGNNKLRFPKRIVAARKSGETEDDPPGWEPFAKDKTVYLRAFADKRQQARALAELMGERYGIRQKTQGAGKESGFSIAAIFRTNSGAALLAEELENAKIPFFMKEKTKSPYAHPVCRDLMAYLEFANVRRDRDLFLRIMNRPCRYLPRQILEETQVSFFRLREACRGRAYLDPILQKLEADIRYLAGMDLYAGTNYVRRGIGYDDWIKKEMGPKACREAMEMADFFQESMRRFETVEQAKAHIESYERALEEAAGKESAQRESGVSLLTMHGAKGLEYDIVFLPDCNEGVTPHRGSADRQETEEERRMFYVGMTRARERLYLSWIGGTQKDPVPPSRFLGDMGYREPFRAKEV